MNGEQDRDDRPPGTYGPPPGYGQVAPWNLPSVVTTWPYGPGRPRIATAAIVLGFVTGGLTALMSLVFLVAVASGDDDLPTTLLPWGCPAPSG
jgi:hypothetical protein